MKSNRICLTTLLLAALITAGLSGPASAGPLGTPLTLSNPRILAYDGSRSNDKSSKKAFFLSLLLPGLGELYAGARYRAVGFMAAEAVTWVAYAHWRSQGTSLRGEFRAYADLNWDEARYREWRAYNAALPPSQQWQETETLPTKAEDTQQYYELIGKYDQFIYGWSDVRDEPLSVNNQNVDSPLQARYEILRNDSNQPLKRASVTIGLTVVNRIISAVHASSYTRLQKGTVENRLRLELAPTSPNGRQGITASITTRF